MKRFLEHLWACCRAASRGSGATSACAIAVLSGIAGCTRDATVHSTAIVAPEAQIIARVNGRPITEAEIKRQAAAAGTDARAALEALVSAEVAAEEAERRELDRAPEVLDASHRELARKLLAQGFEPSLTPLKIPEEELRKLYQRNHRRVEHPELVMVRHILARFSKSDTPERRTALLERAERVAARARRVDSADAFSRLGDELSDASIRLRVEELATAPRGWTVPEFADAAFALDRDGAISGVVETSFGYHVIYRVRRIPAEHISFEEALPKLREALWPDFQRRQFERFMSDLIDRHQVEVHAERLDDTKAPP